MTKTLQNAEDRNVSSTLARSVTIFTNKYIVLLKLRVISHFHFCQKYQSSGQGMTQMYKDKQIAQETMTVD